MDVERKEYEFTITNILSILLALGWTLEKMDGDQMPSRPSSALNFRGDLVIFALNPFLMSVFLQVLSPTGIQVQWTYRV